MASEEVEVKILCRPQSAKKLTAKKFWVGILATWWWGMQVARVAKVARVASKKKGGRPQSSKKLTARANFQCAPCQVT